MAQLLDPSGKAVNEDVLVEPRHPNVMVPGVAVANLLKIWVNGNAAQCQAALPDIVLTGTLHSTGGKTTITISGQTFLVKSIYSRKHQWLMNERCLSGKRNERDNDENYWILGGSDDRRYVIPTNRTLLAKYVSRLNTTLCKDPKNAAIYGYSIR